MNAMEVMTLVLVIFAALSYTDHHNDKKEIASHNRLKFEILSLL